MRRLIIKFLLKILFISGLLSCSNPMGNQHGDAELVFRLALQPSQSSKVWEASRLFKEELERLSEGRIKVLFYPAGVLGNEQQVLETCYLGIIEMVQVTSSVVTTINPLFDVLDMPYLFIDEEHHQKVLHGEIGKELLVSLNNYHLAGLSFYSCGFRNIYANRPVISTDCLKGMKIRVMESSVMVESLNHMGASATALSATEVFTALKTGVVDGAENNPNVYVADGHIEAVKYYSLTSHFSSQHILIANKEWLESVGMKHPDLYNLILEVPVNNIGEFNRSWSDSEEQAYRSILEKGGKIIDVPYSNKLDFMKAVEPVYDLRRKTVLPELVERIRKEAGI